MTLRERKQQSSCAQSSVRRLAWFATGTSTSTAQILVGQDRMDGQGNGLGEVIQVSSRSICLNDGLFRRAINSTPCLTPTVGTSSVLTYDSASSSNLYTTEVTIRKLCVN